MALKAATVKYLANLSEQQSKFGNPFRVAGNIIEKDVVVKEVIKNTRGKLIALIEVPGVDRPAEIMLRNQLISDPSTVKKITIQEFSLAEDLVIKGELVISMEDENGRHTKPFGL